MARDSSPLSKRLKALAVRAGLPVESGQTGGATSTAPVSSPTPDDEQPTGEFPAVAASDTPDEDRPTGEFPAVEPVVAEASPEEPAPSATLDAPVPDTEEPTSQSAGAIPPPMRDETPTAAPADEPPRPTVPPIWTDSPAESQSPLTAKQSDGPTLSPPTLTSLSKPESTPSASGQDDADAASTSAEPAPDTTPEPATQLHEVTPTEPAADGLTDEPASRAAALDEALALEPEPTDESTDTTDESTPDEQATIAAHRVEPPVTEGDSLTGEEPETGPDQTDRSTASSSPETSDADADADAPDAAPTPEPVDKLSLTGRIAAIRRRIRPDSPAAAGATSGASGDSDVSQAPSSADEPPPPVTVVEPSVPDDAHVDEPFAKPSFSERAALRRRVKTLRARRDAGLLEIGAITIDQRRFGDPTAGTLLRRRTDELVDLDNEIAAIEYALEEHASATAIAALGTVRCLGCGTLVGPADRYCAHCGTPRPTDAAPSDARTDQGS